MVNIYLQSFFIFNPGCTLFSASSIIQLDFVFVISESLCMNFWQQCSYCYNIDASYYSEGILFYCCYYCDCLLVSYCLTVYKYLCLFESYRLFLRQKTTSYSPYILFIKRGRYIQLEMIVCYVRFVYIFSINQSNNAVNTATIAK